MCFFFLLCFFCDFLVFFCLFFCILSFSPPSRLPPIILFRQAAQRIQRTRILKTMAASYDAYLRQRDKFSHCVRFEQLNSLKSVSESAFSLTASLLPLSLSLSTSSIHSLISHNDNCYHSVWQSVCSREDFKQRQWIDNKNTDFLSALELL